MKLSPEIIKMRDALLERIGEKPLYYGNFDGYFVFGSELKAITAHPKWYGEINRKALKLLMRYGHIPSPLSIYKGINKLQPGHYVIIRDKGRKLSSPSCFWSLRSVAMSNLIQSKSHSH